MKGSQIDPLSKKKTTLKKPSLIRVKAYIAIHNFDIIYISEIYLNFSTPSDDNNLEISRYTLLCSDHPSNNKRSGVCIYYKSFYL